MGPNISSLEGCKKTSKNPFTVGRGLKIKRVGKGSACCKSMFLPWELLFHCDLFIQVRKCMYEGRAYARTLQKDLPH